MRLLIIGFLISGLASAIAFGGNEKVDLPAYQTKADFLCGLITNSPSFDTSAADAFPPQGVPPTQRPENIDLERGGLRELMTANFEPGIFSVPEYYVMQRYLAWAVKAFRRHGSCVSAARAPFAAPLLSEQSPLQPFFLTMHDQKRIIVSFELSPKLDGSGFLIAAPQLMDEEDGLGVIRPASEYKISQTFVNTLDGTKLLTLIIEKNDGISAKPVVLLRTPYFKMLGQFQVAHYFATADYYLDQGYSFALQAIRGTGGSEGVYRFMSPQEIDDGDAAVRWIYGQDFCNGRIAIVGVSYDGLTALAAGVKNPPGLKVIMAGGSPVQAVNGPFMRNGLATSKQLSYIYYNFSQLGLTQPSIEAELVEKAMHEPDLRKYDYLLYGQTIPEWQELASHFADAQDPFWKTRDFIQELNQIEIPTFHIAGTHHDGDMTDVLNNFIEVSNHSRFPERHRLILGYWDHGNSIPYDDGRNAGQFIRDRFPALLAYHLKGVDTPFVREPRVQVASNLGPEFRGSEVFPQPGLLEHTLYFARIRQDQVLLESKGKQPLLWGIEKSTYLYLPESVNDINSPDPNQSLLFTFKADRRYPALGFMDFDLDLQLEGAEGSNPAQADVLIWVTKEDQTGINPVSMCIMGRKIFAAEANSAGVIHLKSNPCHIMSDILPGDSLRVLVTSNAFPLLFRNTGGTAENYFSHFEKAKVSLLHSQRHPSKMTFRTER